MADSAEGAALFAEHREGLTRYLARIVGHHDVARDLTQEVFLRVARADAPGVDADGTGIGRRAWVFTIARNLALNHLRDRQRQPSTTSMIDVPRNGTQELAAALQQALGTLHELDRDVFLLKESAGLSYDEIAATCDLTADAVRNRLHRARQQLRASLGSAIHFQLQRGIRLTHEP
ncbi:MAG: RNA polymerase sigma factor [Bryobacterales bacterium]|nr:RNA polymerase sigma factor [Caldilineaceae bacterium]MCC6539705.1 RNA polymerase sigma factor [Bryobacterales bacterium]